MRRRPREIACERQKKSAMPACSYLLIPAKRGFCEIIAPCDYAENTSKYKSPGACAKLYQVRRWLNKIGSEISKFRPQ